MRIAHTHNVLMHVYVNTMNFHRIISNQAFWILWKVKQWLKGWTCFAKFSYLKIVCENMKQYCGKPHKHIHLSRVEYGEWGTDGKCLDNSFV